MQLYFYLEFTRGDVYARWGIKVVVNKRIKPTRHMAAAEACGDVLKYTSRLVSCFAYYLFVCRTSLSL